MSGFFTDRRTSWQLAAYQRLEQERADQAVEALWRERVRMNAKELAALPARTQALHEADLHTSAQMLKEGWGMTIKKVGLAPVHQRMPRCVWLGYLAGRYSSQRDELLRDARRESLLCGREWRVRLARVAHHRYLQAALAASQGQS